MLSLAVYESYTPAEDRPRIDAFMERWAKRGSGEERDTNLDPLGNIMMESARNLSGVKYKTKKQSKPKKPKAPKKMRGRPHKLKGCVRGGKVTAAKKVRLR